MNNGFYSKKFPVVASTEEVGSITVEHLWSDVYGLRLKITSAASSPALDISLWETQIKAALQDADSRRAREVMFRLVKDEYISRISKTLGTVGFKKKQERVEFKKSIDQLPDDNGTPLVWKTAEQLEMSPAQIANHLQLMATGDPGHDPSEDPLQFIQDFLVDPVLTAGLGCIHFGFINGQIAAMTVVQINPKSAWSRISYMGVAPEFRQQGLGKWVHRFSFAQMKREGGKLYHGGTAANNHAMIGLFKMHQCDLFQEMEEWCCTFHRGEP